MRKIISDNDECCEEAKAEWCDYNGARRPSGVGGCGRRLGWGGLWIEPQQSRTQSHEDIRKNVLGKWNGWTQGRFFWVAERRPMWVELSEWQVGGLRWGWKGRPSWVLGNLGDHIGLFCARSLFGGLSLPVCKMRILTFCKLIHEVCCEYKSR